LLTKYIEVEKQRQLLVMLKDTPLDAERSLLQQNPYVLNRTLRNSLEGEPEVIKELVALLTQVATNLQNGQQQQQEEEEEEEKEKEKKEKNLLTQKGGGAWLRALLPSDFVACLPSLVKLVTKNFGGMSVSDEELEGVFSIAKSVRTPNLKFDTLQLMVKQIKNARSLELDEDMNQLAIAAALGRVYDEDNKDAATKNKQPKKQRFPFFFFVCLFVKYV
jgi:hypothetical protein